MNLDNRKKPQVPVLELAKFFLSLDPKREYFVKEKMMKVDGMSVSTIGNLRLNKMLHITQILYATKHGQYLFPEKMWAFEHGGIVYDVYRQFHFLVDSRNGLVAKGLTAHLKTFLTKIFNYFKSYSNKQLEDFVHEDPAWLQVWKKDGRKEMSQKREMINYYRKFAYHVAEKIEL